jgi:hypothetical protein
MTDDLTGFLTFYFAFMPPDLLNILLTADPAALPALILSHGLTAQAVLALILPVSMPPSRPRLAGWLSAPWH